MTGNIFDANLKTIGLLHINSESLGRLNSDAFNSYIKVIYLPQGYQLKVDFAVYDTKEASLFFIAPNQRLNIERAVEIPGYFIFYNQDFYCIQLHDDEAACDGLLFNNIHNMPMTVVPLQKSVLLIICSPNWRMSFA